MPAALPSEVTCAGEEVGAADCFEEPVLPNFLDLSQLGLSLGRGNAIMVAVRNYQKFFGRWGQFITNVPNRYLVMT